MSFLDVLFPVQCPGCGQWDVAVCDACLERVGPPLEISRFLPQLSQIGPDGDENPLFPVWTMSSYEDMGRIIQAWKNRPNSLLDRLLGNRIDDCATDMALRLPFGVEIDVVPAPSRPARYRSDTYIAGTIADRIAGGIARGFAERLARATASSQEEQSSDYPHNSDLVRGTENPGGAEAAHRPGRPQGTVVPSVTVTSRTMFQPRQGRQRGRSRQERRGREPVRLVGAEKPRTVLLVDDVATTGSTLEACWQALHQGKHRILGALCISAVIPPGELSVHETILGKRRVK